jgi:hypothetical protein
VLLHLQYSAGLACGLTSLKPDKQGQSTTGDHPEKQKESSVIRYHLAHGT